MLPDSEVTSRGASPPWLGRTPNQKKESKINTKKKYFQRWVDAERLWLCFTECELLRNGAMCFYQGVRWGLTLALLDTLAGNSWQQGAGQGRDLPKLHQGGWNGKFQRNVITYCFASKIISWYKPEGHRGFGLHSSSLLFSFCWRKSPRALSLLNELLTFIHFSVAIQRYQPL